tara:strand:+ start:2151 stop:2447 length:297 start_codon:yes stop_codon:yes gene_type:complete
VSFDVTGGPASGCTVFMFGSIDAQPLMMLIKQQAKLYLYIFIIMCPGLFPGGIKAGRMPKTEFTFIYNKVSDYFLFVCFCFFHFAFRFSIFFFEMRYF